MGNTRAEIALGRKIAEARRPETLRAQEAYARRQQEERDAEDQRKREIEVLSGIYAEAAKPSEEPPAQPEPLPPPSDEEIEEAVKRRSNRVKSQLPSG